jgi:hypothetical protein
LQLLPLLGTRAPGYFPIVNEAALVFSDYLVRLHRSKGAMRAKYERYGELSDEHIQRT